MLSYRFPCGCEFPIIEERGEGELPLLDFDIENVRRDCPATFKLLSTGKTKGIFQLESGIGKRWTKALKPENEEHLGALGSLLRPGALMAIDAEGVSMTEHYCRRKNGQEEVQSYHPIVDEVLKDNYGVMAYQEDAMILAMKVAGFTELQADQLRSAIGKKLANEMAKCKIMFLEGAEKAKVISKEQAEEIFAWIEKSQRYSFNRCCHKDLRIRKAGKSRFSNRFYTVEEMYNIRNSLEYAKRTGHEQLKKKWKILGNYGKGYSLCDDGRLRPNTIVNITKSGELPVFRVTLENDTFVEVTIRHKFPTKLGEISLAEIISQKVEELLTCVAGRVRRGEKGYPSKWIKIKSVVYVGVEETYDVTMEGPNHTFVTDQNIVTCNSHAMSYGITGYDTAYIKAHFPVAFYAGWLSNARHKSKPLDEICELVNDARLFDVDVLPPDLREMSNHFQTDGKKIWFGIGDIKGIGDAQIKKVASKLEEIKNVFGKYIGNLSWMEFLINFSDKLSSSVITRLIEVGAVNWFGMSRLLMKTEYDVWNTLSPAEVEWIRQNKPSDSLKENLKLVARPKKEGGGCHDKRRIAAVLSQLHMLEHPPSPLVDSPTLVAYNEEQLLGISITCNAIDSCDISAVNCSCKEFVSGREGYLMLGVEVKAVRECKTKKGKNPGSKMGRLTISDGTCQVDAIVFPDVWKEKSDILSEGNTVIIQGEHGKDQSELIVKKVWQAQMN